MTAPTVFWVAIFRGMADHPIQIVNLLLEDNPEVLGEATVRLPPRGRRWVAIFTGDEPGVQVARSTGLTDRTAALKLARKWEAEAWVRRGHQSSPSSGRHYGGAKMGGLSHEEVARILKLSARSVRAIEKRALRKLRRHPDLERIWMELETN